MSPFACDPPDLPAALVGLLRGVPAGRAATFGDLAAGLGDRNAAVWCGTVCRRPPPGWADVPVHRAVRAGGECVSPGQAERLAGEGAPVDGNRVNLAACRFPEFPHPGPLAASHAGQDELAGRVRVLPDDAPAPAGRAAAVDVAYPTPRIARAAYVEMGDGDEPAFALAVESRARFPYVRGLLALRELPAYAALFDRLCELGREPGVLFVDGNGVLHPRRCGVASALGVLADVPTVGVAKKKLCGSVVAGGAVGLGGAVELGGEVVGRALANPALPGGNPVFVSPGHRVSVRGAGDLAAAWFRGHRLPEPLFLADRLSKTR